MSDILTKLETGNTQGLSAAEILAEVVRLNQCRGAHYAQTAFAIIALRGQLPHVEKQLRWRGVSEATLKNARQLVRVYEAFVVPGHADMNWLRGVTFPEALTLNKVVALGLKGKILQRKLLTGSPGARREIEHIAATGQSFEEARQASGT